MKNLKLYHIPIIYMILYAIALLATGVWLFLLSQGLAGSELFATFSKIVKSPASKSLHNFIEVATPHIFAIGILIFVVAHFMLFSTKVSQKFSLRISITLFIVAFLNIAAYLLIIFGVVVSGWVKLLTLGLFVLLFLVLLGMVAFSL